MTTEPTQPLTEEDLAVMQGAVERAELFDEETLPLAFSDRKKLLAEVFRLRAELDEARRTAGAEHGRAGALEAAYREACAARDVRDTDLARLRAENTAMAGQLAAVRALPEIEIGPHWNSQSEAEATGRNATLLEVRRVLDGGEPRRADRSQADVVRDFERDMRTVRALGLDQDGNADE